MEITILLTSLIFFVIFCVLLFQDIYQKKFSKKTKWIFLLFSIVLYIALTIYGNIVGR